MKIVSHLSQYAKNVITVELDLDDEGRDAADIITAADNGGVYGMPPRHFGGDVMRYTAPDGTRMARIDVYTD